MDRLDCARYRRRAEGPGQDDSVVSAGGAGRPGRQRSTRAVDAQFVVLSEGRPRQRDLAVPSVRRAVVPRRADAHGARRRLHAGAGALHAGGAEVEPRACHHVVLFPQDLLDRVLPAQREAARGEGMERRADDDAQRRGDHDDAAGRTARRAARARNTCQATNSALKAKPISSVSGTAAIRNAAATNAKARSSQLTGASQ